eukprot:3474217-Rhodomonas_salina.2
MALSSHAQVDTTALAYQSTYSQQLSTALNSSQHATSDTADRIFDTRKSHARNFPFSCFSFTVPGPSKLLTLHHRFGIAISRVKALTQRRE